MTSWTEFHISVVYFSGITIALLSSILILILLRKNIKDGLSKIVGKSNLFWSRTFKSTVILAGLLGAMSVSFRSCNGGYDELLKSKHETFIKGLQQISESFEYLVCILVLWLILFCFYYVIIRKKTGES